jgi:hypothetical protein
MQPLLFPELKRITQYGGSTRRGKRKVARPIAVKQPMHLILKSDNARGSRSLLNKRNARYITKFVPVLAAAYGVNIFKLGNGGTHLHMGVRARDRRGFQNFLRVLGSKLAIYVTGAKKGHKTGKFWTQSAYTKIVESSAQLWELKRYIAKHGGEKRSSTQTLSTPTRLPQSQAGP